MVGGGTLGTLRGREAASGRGAEERDAALQRGGGGAAASGCAGDTRAAASRAFLFSHMTCFRFHRTAEYDGVLSADSWFLFCRFTVHAATNADFSTPWSMRLLSSATMASVQVALPVDI